MSFLNVNRSVTSLVGESRRFRLPSANPFPKLNQRIISLEVYRRSPLGSAHTVTEDCNRVLGGDLGGISEVSTDVMDLGAGYSVENVRRERWSRYFSSRSGWGIWLERVFLRGHRTTRL